MAPTPTFRASRRQLLDLEGEGRRVDVSDARRRVLRDLIARPAAVLRLFVEVGPAQTVWDGWADRSAMAIQPEVHPDQVVEVMAGELALLPSAIATAVGLGVRRDPGEAHALVSRGELRDALRHDQEVDGVGPVTAVWTLHWVRGTAAGEGLTVVDGGAGRSLWVARSVQDESLLLDDAGSLAVWMRLGEVLDLVGSPTEAEASSGQGDLDDAVVPAE